MNIDVNKLDRLLQYILAVAGQADGYDRQLGMIHLIKYVYLADLEYAKYHNGETYTGLIWIFHHFGPWSVECFNRIEPALEAINSERRIISHDKYDDFIRWNNTNPRLFDQLDDLMELSVASSVQRHVNQFGSDTYALLDFVYKTEPMLRAAPEEVLVFEFDKAVLVKDKKEAPKLTARQKKKQKQRIAEFKKEFNRRLERDIRDRRKDSCPLPPRYDDVFFEALSKLDQEAGLIPAEGEYIAEFEEDVWKSKARYDPELS